MTVLIPDWSDLEEVIAAAEHELLVATPYYSDEGLTRLLRLARADSVTVLTRLSLRDWVAGVSDPTALAYTLLELRDRLGEVRLGIVQRLHAKVFVADDALALVGSGNLTAGGFGGNIELAVRLEEDQAEEASRTLLEAVDSAVKWMDLDALIAWVEEHEPVVEETRQRENDEEIAEDVADAQKDLDRLLGHGGGGTTGLPEPDRADLNAFIAWLERNRELAGAEMIIARHHNRPHGSSRKPQNLTGHVKQSFSAAVRFFAEHPRLQTNLSLQLDALGPDDIYQLDPPPVQEAWFRHLDEHATDEGPIYSYPTLRGILPPSTGGTREGGGGGTSTLKRILPLVARYREESS